MDNSCRLIQQEYLNNNKHGQNNVSLSTETKGSVLPANQLSLSFAGCGFLSFYYLGVTSCLQQYSIINSKTIICGASSGVLAGLTLLLDLSLEDSTKQLLDVAMKVGARPLGLVHPSIDLNKIIYEGLMKVLTPDAHKKTSGRLYISVTRVVDGKNVLISQFDSNEDLIRAIQCSCFMPFLSGLAAPKFKGIAYIDGALSNNAPKVDDNTIIVSPWSGEFDICPLNDTSIPVELMFYNKLITVSPSNVYRLSQIAFPPHWDIQSKLCQQGYEDALRFLQRNDKIVCKRCLSPEFYLESNEQIPEIKEKEVVMNGKADKWHHLNANCKDCQIKRQISTVDTIPEAVVQVIHKAYDELNGGLTKKFCRLVPIRLLFILLLPLLLTIEIIIALISGLLFNDWKKEVFRDLLNISNIMINNGLFGKTQKPIFL